MCAESQKLNSNFTSQPKSGTTSTSPAGKYQGKVGRKTKSKFNKKHRKPQKPQVAPSGPVHTYVSKCCNAPARKPKAFTAIAGSKDKTGLGKWRCTGCGKTCKVSVGKPQVSEAQPEVPNVG